MKILLKIMMVSYLFFVISGFIQLDLDDTYLYLLPFHQSFRFNNETALLVHNVIEEENELVLQNQKIYLYNTHQNEQYQTHTVMDGASYLKALLEQKGYEVIFEESNFDQYKKENNMDLTETYPTSRVFLMQNMDIYGPFDLIIDFHRDALNREDSYVTINNTSYAKAMMVIGNDSNNSDKVAYNSQVLHQAVDEIQEGIMRSDFFRGGAVYNQDCADKMLLIEIGGHLNTFDEIKNTLDILAKAIDVCLKEGRFQ